MVVRTTPSRVSPAYSSAPSLCPFLPLYAHCIPLFAAHTDQGEASHTLSVDMHLCPFHGTILGSSIKHCHPPNPFSAFFASHLHILSSQLHLMRVCYPLSVLPTLLSRLSLLNSISGSTALCPSASYFTPIMSDNVDPDMQIGTLAEFDFFDWNAYAWDLENEIQGDG